VHQVGFIYKRCTVNCAPSWFHLQARSQVAPRATITVIHHHAIPFKAGVIISIYLSYLHISKVVWDPAWYSFTHLVDVTHSDVTCLVFRSQLAHCQLPVHFEQSEPAHQGWWVILDIIALSCIGTLAKDLRSPCNSLLSWCIVDCASCRPYRHKLTVWPSATSFDPAVFRFSNRWICTLRGLEF
jgi:hypothetical protein